MGIFSFLKKKTSIDVGTKYLKPSEKEKETGGFVSRTDPSIPATYDPTIKTYSGGGGGGTSLSEYSARSGLTTSQAITRAESQRTISQQELRNISPTIKDLSQSQLREIYDPNSGMYVQSDESGQFLDVTQQRRPPTPQEQFIIDEAQRRGSFEGLGEKLSDFAKEQLKKKIEKDKERLALLGAGASFVYSKAKPVIEKAYDIVSPFVKEQLKEKIEKDQERIRRGNIFFKEVIKPTSKKIYEIVSPRLKQQLKIKLERDKRRLELGNIFIQKAKPYVEKVYDVVSPIVGKELAKRGEGYKEKLSLFGAGVSWLYGKRDIISKGKPEILPKEVSAIGFVGKISKESREARERGDKTYTILGEELPTYPAKGEIYNIYKGVLDFSAKGYEDIAKTTGISKFGLELKQYQDQPFISEMTVPYMPPPTPEEIQAQSERFGKQVIGAVEFGTYFTPIAGAKIIAGAVESQFSPFKLPGAPQNIVEFVKEEPGDVLYLGTLGAIKGYQVLRGIPKVSPEIISISRLDREGIGIVGRASRQVRGGGKTITEYPLLGTGRTFREGRQTIVRTRTQEILNKLFGGDRKIYGGSYQLDKKGYNLALKRLVKQGYSEPQARNILREVSPKVSERVFSGIGRTIEGESGVRILIKGGEKTIPIKTIIDGTKTKLGRGEFKAITSVGKQIEVKGVEGGLFKFKQVESKSFLRISKPTEEIGREGVIRFAKRQLIRKDLIPFSKISQKGKTISAYDIITGSKLIKEIRVPTRRLLKDYDLFEIKDVEVYKVRDVVKKVFPKKRGIQISDSKVIVEKGEPKIVYDLDEALGITDVKVMRGGGKPSSQRYLQELSQKEEGLVGGLKEIIKPKTIPVKTPKVFMPSPTVETKPASLFAGTGLYERTEEVSVPSIQRDGNILSVSQGLGQVIDTKESTSQKLFLETKMGAKETDIQMPSLISSQKEGMKEKQMQETSQALAQALQLKQTQKGTIAQQQKLKEEKSKKGRGLFFQLPFIKLLLTGTKPPVKIIKEEAYDVGTIRKNKAKIIKRGMNLRDARDYGARKVLDTLRATFYLIKSKQRAVDVPDTNVFSKNRDLFRLPKQNSKLYQKIKDVEEIYVQRKHKTPSGRGSRLGMRSEVSEILGLKGQVDKKVNNNIGNEGGFPILSNKNLPKNRLTAIIKKKKSGYTPIYFKGEIKDWLFS